MAKKNVANAKVFKVIGGKARVLKGQKDEGCREVEYTYNVKHPVFETNDFDEALYMWDRLCDEVNRSHMLLIADFGLQTKGQCFRNNLCGCNGVDTNYNHVVPYFQIAEFHKGKNYGSRHYYEVVVSDGFRGGEFKDEDSSIKAMRRFIHDLQIDRTVRMDVVEKGTDIDNVPFTRIRTVASSKMLDAQMEYYGCSTIKQYHSYTKKSSSISLKTIEESNEDENSLKLYKMEDPKKDDNNTVYMDDLDDVCGTTR